MNRSNRPVTESVASREAARIRETLLDGGAAWRAIQRPGTRVKPAHWLKLGEALTIIRGPSEPNPEQHPATGDAVFGCVYPGLAYAAEVYAAEPDKGIPAAILNWYRAGKPIRPMTPRCWLPPFDKTLPRALEAWAQLEDAGIETEWHLRCLGDALRIGQHLYGLGEVFDRWCVEYGLGDVPVGVRVNVMRLAPTVCPSGHCRQRGRGCDQSLGLT